MKKILSAFLLASVLSGCQQQQESTQEPLTHQEKELLLETEHCRYYCFSRHRLGPCKIVVCEYDESYMFDTSLSW